MKRDLDLVRCILISVEKSDGPIGDAMLAKCCEDISRLAFHVELMQAHGLLTASVKRDACGDPLSLEVGGLTWGGATTTSMLSAHPRYGTRPRMQYPGPSAIRLFPS